MAEPEQDHNGVYRCPNCSRGFWTKRGVTLHALGCLPQGSGEGDRG